MRTIKFTDLITKSIKRTKLILFQPFLLKKWLRLLLIGVLAGVITGGGIGGGRSVDSSKKADAAPELNPLKREMTVDSSSTSESAETKTDQRSSEFKAVIRQGISYLAAFPPNVLFGISFVLVFVFTGAMLFIMWLNSRFKFVWLHAIIQNDAAISNPFRQYRKEGNSFFKLEIVAGLVVLISLGLLGTWAYFGLASAGFFKHPVASVATAMVSLAGAFVIFIAGLILICVWAVFVDHFVVPIMAINKETYLPAWNKFSKIYENNKGDCWLYLFVLLGLGIVCSILEGIIFLIVLIVSAIVGAIIFGIGYLIFYILLKAKILFVGFAIGAGIPMVIVFILAALAIVLPFAVFFRSFSLYFLSSLNEGYSPLILNEAQGE
jgi:hypothetical protein